MKSAERKFEYIKPEHSNDDTEYRSHHFELKQGGEVAAVAEVYYRSKPIPHYYLGDLFTQPRFRDKKCASQLMEQVEEFLRKRKKPGILHSQISSSEPAWGMYERRGWELLDLNEGHLHAYNLPPEIDRSLFIQYHMRGEDVSDWN